MFVLKEKILNLLKKVFNKNLFEVQEKLVA